MKKCKKRAHILKAHNDTKLFAAIEGLKSIRKWEFAGDGRKFSGNHKEVLKHVLSLADETLRKLGVQ